MNKISGYNDTYILYINKTMKYLLVIKKVFNKINKNLHKPKKKVMFISPQKNMYDSLKTNSIRVFCT